MIGALKDKHIRIALIALGVLLLITAVLLYEYHAPGGYRARRDADLRTIDTKAKPYETLTGEPRTLADYQGKILIVHVWASWSPYTEGELEKLSALAETYGDRIHIVALNRMEDSARARAYLATLKEFPQIEFVLDSEDSFFKTIGGYAMPETVLFDTIGNIALHVRGTLDVQDVRAALDTLLAGS